MVDGGMKSYKHRYPHCGRIRSRVGNGDREVAKLRVLYERDYPLKAEAAAPWIPRATVRECRAKRNPDLDHQIRHRIDLDPIGHDAVADDRIHVRNEQPVSGQEIRYVSRSDKRAISDRNCIGDAPRRLVVNLTGSGEHPVIGAMLPYGARL